MANQQTPEEILSLYGIGPKAPETGILDRAKDLGISALKGAIGVPESFVGLADIPTLGGAGKLVQNMGVDFKKAKEILDTWYSPAQREAFQKVNAAKGFFPTVGTMLENPSTIVHSAGESLLPMLGGAAIGRGALGAIGKFAPSMAEGTASALAAGIGEGALTTGQNLEQVRQGTESGYLTPGQVGSQIAAGAITGGIGAASGGIANKLGLGDIDQMLVKGSLESAETAAKAPGFLKRALGGALTEGVLEELPQSYQEQGWQNIAQGKPWNEGAAEAGAQGMLAGGLMGLVGGGMSKPHAPALTTGEEADNQVKETLNAEKEVTQGLGVAAASGALGSLGSPSQSVDLNGRPVSGFGASQGNLFGGVTPNETIVPQETPQDISRTVDTGRLNVQTDELGNAVVSPIERKTKITQFTPVDVAQEAARTEEQNRAPRPSLDQIYEAQYKEQLKKAIDQAKGDPIKEAANIEKIYKSAVARAESPVRSYDGVKDVSKAGEQKTYAQYVKAKIESSPDTNHIQAVQDRIAQETPVDNSEQKQASFLDDNGQVNYDYTTPEAAAAKEEQDKRAYVPTELQKMEVAAEENKAHAESIKPEDIGRPVSQVVEDTGVGETADGLFDTTEPTPVAEVAPDEAKPAAETKKKKGGPFAKPKASGEAKASVKRDSNHPAVKATKEEIVRLVDKITGNKGAVAWTDAGDMVRTRPDGTKYTIDGETIANVIHLVADDPNVKSIAKHETIHVLRNLGLISEKEWNVLKAKAEGWIKKYSINEDYPNLNKEQKIEEAIARAFEQNAEKSSVFNKIKEFIEKLINFVKGQNFESSSSVFSKIESGVVGARNFDFNGGIVDATSKPAISKAVLMRQAAEIFRGVVRPSEFVHAQIENAKGQAVDWTDDLNTLVDKLDVKVSKANFTTKLTKLMNDGILKPIVIEDGAKAHLGGVTALFAYHDMLQAALEKVEGMPDEHELDVPIITAHKEFVTAKDLRDLYISYLHNFMRIRDSLNYGNFTGMLEALNNIELLGFAPYKEKGKPGWIQYYNRRAMVQMFTFKHFGGISELAFPEYYIHANPNSRVEVAKFQSRYNDDFDTFYGSAKNLTDISTKDINTLVFDSQMIKDILRTMAGKDHNIYSMRGYADVDNNAVANQVLQLFRRIGAVTTTDTYGNPIAKVRNHKDRGVSFARSKEQAELNKQALSDMLGEYGVISSDMDYENLMQVLTDAAEDYETEINDLEAAGEDAEYVGTEREGIDVPAGAEFGAQLGSDINEPQTHRADTKGFSREMLQGLGIMPRSQSSNLDANIHDYKVQGNPLAYETVVKNMKNTLKEFKAISKASVKEVKELMKKYAKKEVLTSEDRASFANELAQIATKALESVTDENNEVTLFEDAYNVTNMSKGKVKKLTEMYPFLKVMYNKESHRELRVGMTAPEAYGFSLYAMIETLKGEAVRHGSDPKTRTNAKEKLAMATLLYWKEYGEWPQNLRDDKYINTIINMISNKEVDPDLNKITVETEKGTIIVPEGGMRDLRTKLLFELGYTDPSATKPIYQQIQKAIQITRKRTDKKAELITMPKNILLARIDKMFKIADGPTSDNLKAISVLRRTISGLQNGLLVAGIENNTLAYQDLKELNDSFTSGSDLNEVRDKLRSIISQMAGKVMFADDVKEYIQMPSIEMGSLFKDHKNLSKDKKREVIKTYVPMILKEVSDILNYNVSGRVIVDKKGEQQLQLFLDGAPIKLDPVTMAPIERAKKSFIGRIFTHEQVPFTNIHTITASLIKEIQNLSREGRIDDIEALIVKATENESTVYRQSLRQNDIDNGYHSVSDFRGKGEPIEKPKPISKAAPYTGKVEFEPVSTKLKTQPAPNDVAFITNVFFSKLQSIINEMGRLSKEEQEVLPAYLEYVTDDLTSDKTIEEYMWKDEIGNEGLPMPDYVSAAAERRNATNVTSWNVNREAQKETAEVKPSDVENYMSQYTFVDFTKFNDIIAEAYSRTSDAMLNREHNYYKNSVTGQVVYAELSQRTLSKNDEVHYWEVSKGARKHVMTMSYDHFNKQFNHLSELDASKVSTKPSFVEVPGDEDNLYPKLTDITSNKYMREFETALRNATIPQQIIDDLKQLMLVEPDIAEKRIDSQEAINNVIGDKKNPENVFVKTLDKDGNPIKANRVSWPIRELTKAANIQAFSAEDIVARLKRMDVAVKQLGRTLDSNAKMDRIRYEYPALFQHVKRALEALKAEGFLSTAFAGSSDKALGNRQYTAPDEKGITREVRSTVRAGSKYRITDKLFDLMGDQHTRSLESQESVASTWREKVMTPYVDSKGNWRGVYKALKSMAGDNVKEGSLIKTAYNIVKGLVNMPFWQAMRLNRDYGSKAALDIMNTANRKTEMNDTWKMEMAKLIAPSNQTVKQFTPEVRSSINHLINYSDAYGKFFQSFKEAQKISPQLTQEAFDHYKQLANDIKEQMPSIMIKGGATAYITKFATIFNDPTIVQKVMDTVGKEYGGLTKSEAREMARQIMPEAIKDTKWEKAFVSHVQGYNDYLSSVKGNIAQTPFWMPRMRRLDNVAARAFLRADDKRKLIALKYFPTHEEAEAWLTKLKNKDPEIWKYKEIPEGDIETKTEFTSSNDMGMYSTMDSASEFSNMQTMFDQENAPRYDNPWFGNAAIGEGAIGSQNVYERRNNDLILGYDTHDYMENYQTAMKRIAMSYSRLEYGMTQFGNLANFKAEAEKNPKLNKFVDEMTKHLQHDLKRAGKFDGLGNDAKKLTAFMFMGFKFISPIINATQPFITGAAELAKMYKAANGKSYTANYIQAVQDIAKFTHMAAKDINNSYYDEDKTMSKSWMGDIVHAGIKGLHNAIGANGEVKMPKNYRDALDKYSRAGLFRGAFNDIHLLNNLDDAWRERKGGILDRQDVNALVDNSLKAFSIAELINREGSFLAAYDHAYKNAPAGVDADAYAFDKASNYVSQSQYMVNKFNMPLSIKELGPAGNAMFGLMSFPFNMMNQIQYHIGSTKQGDYDSAKVLLGIIGALMVAGGAGALPFKDFFELIYGMLANRDKLGKIMPKGMSGNFDVDARRFMRTIKTPEMLQDVIMGGIPVLAGLNVSANLGMQTPLIGGALQNKSAVESISGATGGMIKKLVDGGVSLSRGEIYKAFESVSPEFLAAPLRGYRQYSEGSVTKGGTPVYIEGKPLRETAGEAISSSLGFKPQSWAKKQEIRNSERQLKNIAKEKHDTARAALVKGNAEPTKDYVKWINRAQVQGIAPKPATKIDVKPNKNEMGWQRAERTRTI